MTKDKWKKKEKKKKSEGSESTTNSSISTAGITAIVEQLRNQRNRSSTKSNYYRIWKFFNKFVIRLDVKPKNWGDRLVLFVGYLIENDKKSSTIKSYVSAIRAVLKQNNIKLIENNYLITSLTKACRFKNDQVSTRLPIRRNLLELMIDSMVNVFQQDKVCKKYLIKMY